MVTLPGSLSVVWHNGGTTVGHITTTETIIKEFQQELGKQNCIVKYWCIEQDTSTLPNKDTVFPSNKCVDCNWFDVQTENTCMLKYLDSTSIKQLCEQDRYVTDRNTCPVPEHWVNN